MSDRWITGWKPAASDRARLLALVPPQYAKVVADHVTLQAGTDEHTPLPTETSGEVVGVADDGTGVQALIVRILERESGGAIDPPPTLRRVNGAPRRSGQAGSLTDPSLFQGVEKKGTTDRPDGSSYHLTWSLGEGRRAVESNEVIARLGWRAWDAPVGISLVPSRWLWGDA